MAPADTLRSADLVDWSLAVRVAGRLSGREPLAASYHADSLHDDFTELTAIAEERVTEVTGLRPADGPARARVVDRPAWVEANVASFRRLLSPLLDKMAASLDGKRVKAPVAVTRSLAGAELGAMLGWMSQRVLGQYDLLVMDDETRVDQDVVYYVGPNVVSIERRFGFPPREFRLWLALHEVTHRAQFTGVPWLRGHFLGLVDETLGSVDPDPGRLLAAVRESMRQTAEERRQRLTEGGMAALVASPEQRAGMARIGGLMSLLEGHGDVTMDRAAGDLVPSAERFSRVLKERRRTQSAVARLVQRLTGLEAKLAQYEAGEQFLAAIEAVHGPRAVDRCWQEAVNLPTLEEIREPDRWLQRMAAAAA